MSHPGKLCLTFGSVKHLVLGLGGVAVGHRAVVADHLGRLTSSETFESRKIKRKNCSKNDLRCFCPEDEKGILQMDAFIGVTPRQLPTVTL